MTSPETYLMIDFDNAASHAVIYGPAPVFGTTNGRVRVRGAVVEGARVSIGGQASQLDRHGRFDLEVAVPPNHDGLAIRIEDRQGRIHYYVRRARPGEDG